MENVEQNWVMPEEEKKPKKKLKTWQLLVIFLSVCVLVVGICLGIYFYLSSPEKFTSKDGKISITMTKSFDQKDDTYLRVATSKAVFFVDRVDFDLYEINGWIIDELDSVDVAYMDSSLVNGIVTIDDENGLVYYEYVDQEAGESYYNLVVVIEGEEEFWFGCFYCFEEDKDSFKNQFVNWATTIEINA